MEVDVQDDHAPLPRHQQLLPGSSTTHDDDDDDVVASDFSTGYMLARRLGARAAEEEDMNTAAAAAATGGGGGSSEYLRRGRANVALAAGMRSDETSYKDALEASELEREKQELLRKIRQAEANRGETSSGDATLSTAHTAATTTTAAAATSQQKKRTASRWDQTPVMLEKPAPPPPTRAMMGPPALPSLSQQQQQPAKRSRWDQTPVAGPSETPISGANKLPLGTGALTAMLPPPLPGFAVGGSGTGALVPTRDGGGAGDINRPWTDAELDMMIPREGYEIVPPPPEYESKHKARAASLLAPPTPVASGADGGGATAGYSMPESRPAESYGISLQKTAADVAASAASGKPGSDLPFIKPEDMQYFGKLLEEDAFADDSREDQTEKTITTLLLKIKNGLPSMRKQAMRQITDDAPKLGAGPLFNQILPLLMSPTLDEQERHLLVKVVDRVLFRLEDAVRPFAHKILAVIEPLLIEEDYYARVEGREIIANLAKACGLATMIATMRPDIDNTDEFVRNTTARALSVVASALGVQTLCPFLRAVCRSKKSWEARHTGTKVVQQISILMGCGVLPHLKSLVECIAPGLKDEQIKVRTMTALSLASLAEAAHPYGYEFFVPVQDALWEGIAKHRGKGLAAFIKCVGCIIPLMDEELANTSAQRIVPILVREFKSPDDETKKIVLRAVKQCVTTHGVSPTFIRDEVLPPYFESFWIRRHASDRRNHEALVDTTVALASRVGAAQIVERLVPDFKDESEPYRRMVMDCTDKVLKEIGVGDVSLRLEERLVDGALFAFQEQDQERTDPVMLRGFVRVIVALGTRSKPYLAQIAATAKWRLQNKHPGVRMQTADLIAGLAPVMKACGEEELLGHLGVILYENLGEEFPDVLGSILGALKHVVVNLGVDDMTPPIRDLLPRLTPILRNSNEKVAENLIDLVGRIADAGAAQVAAREWMRICFDLLEMLRSPRMSIRRAAVNTFGFIARAIGPQDVLHTLLTNLRVQERQMRVCTTVAIAIVAESCAPFTVLPALMNEYRQPDVNIQNGVLKAISFMLQYVGPMSADYIYALTPLLQDALSDRDHVHRQTACDAVKHLALGVAGRGCEDSLVHLLNFVFPNIFEQSPHVARAVLEAVEALRVPLGVGRMLLYLLPGLFHPARFVRTTYWRLYNNLYVGDSDAMVPYYPRLELVPSLEGLGGSAPSETPPLPPPSKRRDRYRRTHLELFI